MPSCDSTRQFESERVLSGVTGNEKVRQWQRGLWVNAAASCTVRHKEKEETGQSPSEDRTEKWKKEEGLLLQAETQAAAGPLRTSSDRSCPETQDSTSSVIKSSQVGCEISKQQQTHAWHTAYLHQPDVTFYFLTSGVQFPYILDWNQLTATLENMKVSTRTSSWKGGPIFEKVLRPLCAWKGFTVIPAALKTLKPTSINLQKATSTWPRYRPLQLCLACPDIKLLSNSPPMAFTHVFPRSSSFLVVTCRKRSKYCTSSTSLCHLLQGKNRASHPFHSHPCTEWCSVCAPHKFSTQQEITPCFSPYHT